MICENCLYKLELFYDFRERTVRTERLLLELYREIVTNISNIQLNHDLNQQTCMVSLDNSELITVDHQHLVDYENLHNVSNISLPSMDACADMIVENQIGLNLKSFCNIDVISNNLENHNHSNLHIQDSSLLASSDSQESHIQGDLHLNQSFAEQIEFQLSLQEKNLRDIASLEDVNTVNIIKYFLNQNRTNPN